MRGQTNWLLFLGVIVFLVVLVSLLNWYMEVNRVI